MPPAPLLRRIDLRNHAGNLRDALPGPSAAQDDTAAIASVRAILDQVRTGGDQALMDLTARFDGIRPEQMRVPSAELKGALERVPDALRDALEAAHDAIGAFHSAQLRQPFRHERDGIVAREVPIPVDRAGVYVPGGRAPLASSVLMTVVPARIAGTSEIALCSPPRSDGSMHDAILAAAAIAGADEVYRIGGAQAIAALAYGTETIRQVDVIAGPGNRYVALAQRLVAAEGLVGVPRAFAGPSEVAVIADGTTPPAWVATDLMVQAEHGPDGISYLVSWSEEVAGRVEEELRKLVPRSPRREDIAGTLDRGGYSVLVAGPEQAMEVANAIAPEHLELLVDDPEPLASLVKNAGAVFLGPLTPASLGDYMAGPNHVLPTARSARFAGALGTDDFLKPVHFVEASRGALERVAPRVAELARAEGMAVHAESMLMRAKAQ